MAVFVRIGVFKSRKAAISNGVRASGNMAHSVTSVSATRTEMKYCMSCGKQMPSEMNFCGHCGKEQLPTPNLTLLAGQPPMCPQKPKVPMSQEGFLRLWLLLQCCTW